MSALGMVSPVGASASQTFTSVRAGLCRMRELPAIYSCLPEDPRFDAATPLIGSAVYHLDEAARRNGRTAEWFALLAAHAFRDLKRQAHLTDADLNRLGLFLALPQRAALPATAREELIYHFHNYAEQDLLPNVQFTLGDRTAPLALAEQAATELQKGRIGLAVVGGVDSYLFADRLAALDGDWRLLSERNPDGFRPGEAAGLFLLERRAGAVRRGLAPRAVVRGFASGRAEASATPNTGSALAAVLEPLLPVESALLFVCDLNGESSRMREWGYAVSRLGQKLSRGYALEHPASVLGDVGTAAGAIQVALAVQYFTRKHSRRDHALVWAAADDGERRALLLGRA